MAKYHASMTTSADVSGDNEVRLSRTLGALSDPTRRAIVGRLSKGSATAGELAEPFSIGLSTVSKHLRTLEDAGLVLRERAAQWHVFRLRAQPLAELNDWLHAYEAFWLGTLDSLHDYVKQFGTRKVAASAKPGRTPVGKRPASRRRPRS
jgi:DNA-binding transcriptional ArsR family regulator